MAEHNAVIKSTTLGYEDHGVLSFWLHLDYGGTGQSFGGYTLDSPGENHKRIGSVFGREIAGGCTEGA